MCCAHGQIGKHLCPQCFRHNVCLFATALIFFINYIITTIINWKKETYDKSTKWKVPESCNLCPRKQNQYFKIVFTSSPTNGKALNGYTWMFKRPFRVEWKNRNPHLQSLLEPFAKELMQLDILRCVPLFLPLKLI